MLKKDFNFLLELLRQNAGWQFNEEQYFIIEKKISNFMRGKNYNSVEDLVAELKIGKRQLIEQVVEALAFSDTSFFRDAAVFDGFARIALPKLKDKCRARKQLDVWSMGCSTGQEAYSIAMVFDKLKKEFANWQINIMASDMSAVALNKAQRGSYSNFEIQTGLNARDILQYFENRDEQWVAREDLRKKIDFRRYNMLDEAIVSSKFEVVFCRNVLRYFAPEHQDMILQRISQIQPQGGYLYLGIDEVVPAVEKYYYRPNDNSGAYVAIGAQKQGIKVGNISISAPAQSEAKDGEVQMPSFTRPKNLM
ncbi:MAG: protein-glutamate O-methyltransferase CheR [Alphaproteobacteria bacterium]|nr:protein-glutamate O-methyltransferase CheR [Alphaproteobacteria bacterium]